MSEVKRYDPAQRGFNKAPMDEDIDGDYVLHSDFEKLKNRLDATNKELGLNIKSHLNDICTLEKLKAQLEKAENILKSFISGSCLCGRSEWCFECTPDSRKNNTREYFKEKEQK